MKDVGESILAAETPGFVEQAPGENGRMIEIALDSFAQHGFKAAAPERSISPLAEVGKIRHEQNAQSISPVEKEWIVHLDMDAEKVKTELFGGSNVVLESFDRGRGVHTVGIVGLI